MMNINSQITKMRDKTNNKIIKKIEVTSYPCNILIGQEITKEMIILKVTYTDNSTAITHPDKIQYSNKIKQKSIIIISYNSNSLIRPLEIS